MLNNIILMGRLTRDPELRRTQSGLAVTRFTLAVERDRAAEGAEKQTDFIDIVSWRNTAEFVSKYFVKGQLVAVNGRLQLNDWTDNNGTKRRSAEVLADHVYFAEAKRDGNHSQPAANYNTQPQGGFTDLPEDDGDLPF